MEFVTFATAAQKDYIKLLCEKLGYDCDDYINIDLTKQDASRIISELKEEWEG